MSTDIRVTCKSCGSVSITDSELNLQVCTTVRERSYYEFSCPKCTTHNRQLLSAMDLFKLTSAGIKVKEWTIPPEALEPKYGKVVDLDDLIDLMTDLEHERDWSISSREDAAC